MHSTVHKLTKASTVKLEAEVFEMFSVLRNEFKFDLMLIVLFRLKKHSFPLVNGKNINFIPNCKMKHLYFLFVNFLARIIFPQ